MSLRTLHWDGCSGKNESIAYSVTDLNHRIGDEVFLYVRCEQCGLIRLSNPPQDMESYYPTSYHEFPSLSQLAAIADRSRYKIDTVLRFVDSGKLLEIGPSYGLFTYQAKQAGFDVRAIEMDERCCEYLENTMGIPVERSNKPEDALANMEKHNVIVLWHVIEHLVDPWAVLRAASENLDAGGVLVLAAPNPDSWQFKVMGAQWPHLDAPRHLYLFPADLLTGFCSSLGLERIYETTIDSEAKGWNRFGWQRLLMNLFSNSWLKQIAFVFGYALSFVFLYFDGREPRGSAYTMIFRKV